MRGFQKILVGLDLDPDGTEVTKSSNVALLQAQWLAEKIDAGLTLFHSTFERTTAQEGLDELERLRLECETAGSPTETVVSEERPWLEIIRRVLRGENDFVVVAKRDKNEEEQVGTTSRKLLRKCPAPVFAVEPDHELVHGDILSATDLSPVGDRAVEYGAFLADALGCEHHVVHAWQVPFQLQMEAGRLSDEEVAEHRTKIEQAALDQIRGVLRPLGYQRSPSIAILCDAPSHAIKSEIKRHEPDLVVMGTVSRGGIAGFLVGNTAEKLFDRIESSLLTVKPEDFICPITLED